MEHTAKTIYSMYPGPVNIHPKALEALSKNYFPARYSPEFKQAYQYICSSIQELCNTKNDVLIATGEAMLALWATLKSTLQAKDKVLTIGTGVFGDGFADMAESLGCEVCRLSFPYNQTIGSDEYLKEIELAIDSFKPKMITLVHCETPSGTLNPLERIGALKKAKNVPLLIVDAVSSIGGVPIKVDECSIDILLGGSQKCFSCPADTSLLTVSQVAWNYIEEVNYQGYDALKPFSNFIKAHCDMTTFPYTPNSSSVFALAASIKAMEEEGYDNVFKRHTRVAELCRKGIEELGLELFPDKNAISSPTVTAVCLPSGTDWKEKQEEIKKHGIFLAGSIGKLENKIFRIGHMGTQANEEAIQKTLAILSHVFGTKKKG